MGSTTIIRNEKRRLILLGILIYLFLIIVFAPSTLLSLILDKTGTSAIGLQNTTGTIWRGSGLIVSAKSKDSAYVITRVNWDMSILRLLAGQVHTELSFNDDALMGKGSATLSFGKIELENFRVGMPASTISVLYAPAMLLGPAGNITFNSKSLVVTKNSFAGEVKIQWHDAGSKMSQVKPLGSYELTIKGNSDGKKASVDLKTLNGKLNAAANGQWDIGKTGNLNLAGFATPESSRTELEPLLQLLGRDMGNGKRKIFINRKISF